MDYRFTGLSIWLEPDPKESEPIQRLIDKYQALGEEPYFPVHATVLYSMDPALLHGGEEEFLTRKLEEVSPFDRRYSVKCNLSARRSRLLRPHQVVASLPSRLIFLSPKKVSDS